MELHLLMPSKDSPGGKGGTLINLQHKIDAHIILNNNSRDCFTLQFCMKDAINSVLIEAKEYQRSTHGRTKVPIPLKDDDIGCLKVIRDLLQPLSELTDDFQSDGVSSSMAIIGVINALRGRS